MDAELVNAYVDNAFVQMLLVAERTGPALNERPFGPTTNSVASLIIHCAAVCEFWLGHVILGRPSERNRDAEFDATADLEGLRTRVERCIVQVAADLEALAGLPELGERPDGPSELREFALGGGSDESVVQHVLQELHQHLGQMELTADAFAAR